MPIILTRHNKRTRTTDILIVLEHESVERIQQRDPFELDARAVAERHGPDVRVGAIGVVSGSEPDIAEIIRLQRAGKHDEAMAYAIRGWSMKSGDDMPLTRVGVASKATS